MKTIRVVRVIVYEGPENWVTRTLSQSQLPHSLGDSSRIYEKERWQDLTYRDPLAEPSQTLDVIKRSRE